MRATYHDELRDPRWIALRDKVRARDGQRCVQCSADGELHVHHAYYRDGRRAWEYRESDLITLCAKCHEKNHGIGAEGPKDDELRKHLAIFGARTMLKEHPGMRLVERELERMESEGVEI